MLKLSIQDTRKSSPHFALSWKVNLFPNVTSAMSLTLSMQQGVNEPFQKKIASAFKHFLILERSFPHTYAHEKHSWSENSDFSDRNYNRRGPNNSGLSDAACVRDPLNLVPNGDLLRAWKSIKIAHHYLARCLAFLHCFPICCSHCLLMLWPCSVQSHRHVLKITKFRCSAKLGSWETGLRVGHMTCCGHCRDGLPFLVWSPMNVSIVLQGGILDCHFASEELATVFVEHEFPVLSACFPWMIHAHPMHLEWPRLSCTANAKQASCLQL